MGTYSQHQLKQLLLHPAWCWVRIISGARFPPAQRTDTSHDNDDAHQLRRR